VRLCYQNHHLSSTAVVVLPAAKRRTVARVQVWYFCLILKVNIWRKWFNPWPGGTTPRIQDFFGCNFTCQICGIPWNPLKLFLSEFLVVGPGMGIGWKTVFPGWPLTLVSFDLLFACQEGPRASCFPGGTLIPMLFFRDPVPGIAGKGSLPGISCTNEKRCRIYLTNLPKSFCNLSNKM